MSKVDLHVHSIYSEHPSDWFLHRIGAGESYTDPFFIYKKMKQRGMDFVTRIWKSFWRHFLNLRKSTQMFIFYYLEMDHKEISIERNIKMSILFSQEK